MDIKQLLNHPVCVSSVISVIYKQGWMMSVTADSMSHHLREREPAMRHWRTWQQTANSLATSRRCTGVTLISYIMSRNIWRQLLRFNKDKKAGSSNTNRWARHCGWSRAEMEAHCDFFNKTSFSTWILLEFVKKKKYKGIQSKLV